MPLDAIALTVGLGMSSYTEEKGPEPEPHFRVSVGHEDYPWYAYGQYESLTPRILGQGVADLDVYSFGVGARKYFGEFWVFGELGYGVLNDSQNDAIRQEIVYTELVRNHNVEFRPIPVYPTGPYDQDSYETSWEVDGGFLGAVGIGYQPHKNVGLSVAYRPFYGREHIELYDAERRANGGGWWQETRNLDLSSWEFRAEYTF